MVNNFYGECGKKRKIHHFSPFFKNFFLNFAFFLSHGDILNIQNNILNYQLALFTNIKYLTNVLTDKIYEHCYNMPG